MNAEMYVSYGIELVNKGALEQARQYFDRALELRPDYPEAYNSLGVVFIRSNQPDEAEKCLRYAIKLKAEYPEAYNNLGVLLKGTNRVDEAGDCLRRAVGLRPDYPEGYVNLGEVYRIKDQPAEAEDCFRQAIRLNPDCPEAYNSLGLTKVGARLPDEAASLFRHAIGLKFDYPEAYHNLGSVLSELGRLVEAEDCLRQAIAFRSDFPEANNSLGLVCKKTNRLEQAESYFRRSIGLRPDYPQAWVNLAMVLQDTCRLDEAEGCLRRVIKLCPGFPEADFALGILSLLRGQYDEWWGKYELRCRVLGYRRPDIRPWQGEDLTGRKILLFHEQGYGDTLQFARYAGKVAALAAKAVLWVPGPLVRLLSTLAAGLTVVSGDTIRPEEYDFACPLPSLPFVFRTSRATIPRDIPYLQPDGEASARWRDILAKPDGGRCRVGVVWAGNPEHKNDYNRSIPFALFSRLFQLSGVDWVSLQTGPQAEELKTAGGMVMDCSSRLVDFAETAASIDNLDLIITVDTATAHLAGAMGKNTWVLLPFAPDWRWQLETEDSLWYPTIRLFRQRKIGDWQEVLARVEEAVRVESSETGRKKTSNR